MAKREKVSPLCTVRRSRSFPNGSETTDRAAEIEDFLSSRSGVTDLSMDKQEQAKITRQEKDEDRKKKRKREKEKKKKKKKENAGKRGEEKNEKEDGENYDDDEDEEDDEEEDNWKDASPITPISSPTRKSSRVERQEDKKVSTTKVQEEPKSLVPSSDETKITSSIGDQNGVAAASGTPELAEAPTTGELVAPRVKLKETTRENTVAKDSATESGGSQRRDRRKALTRHGSLDSKAQETSEKSEASLSEKGAKKKVLKDRDETGSKRRAGRKGVEAKSSDRERRSRFGRSSESIELMELGRGSDEVAKRSREERKSLKEQECIERVTQFLSKHSDFSMASPYQPEYSIFEEEKLYEQEGASIGSRPARLELEGAAMAEVTSPSGENAASRRKRDSSELESSRRSEAESPDSSYHRAVESFHKDGGSRWVSERIGEKSVALASTGQTPTSPGGSEPPKRPSSLRKKKDAFSRESSRESLLDDAKKEVRIQEDVEEIFFEDASEQLSVYLPEVQLVKARIITADEALARLTCDDRQQDRAAGVAPEVRPPPEVATVPEHPSPSRERGISEASAKTTLVQLRPLVTLTKAISENALVDKSGSLLLDDSGKAADTNDVVDGGEEENRVSERNIKPEILLDLSKVMEASVVDVVKERKPLARTGSEGSKKRGSFSGAKSRLTTADRRGVIVGSLALPSQPELTNVGGSESDSERKAFFAYADRSAVVVAERISSETPVKEPAKEVSPAAPKFRTEEKEEDKKEESEQKREEERQDREDQQDPQRRKKTKKELGRRDEDESGVGEEAEAKEQEGKSKDFLRQQVRASLLGEEQEVDDVLVVVGGAVVNGRAARQREEDGLISKEHSLEYQSQTLESQQPERSTQQQLQHYQDFPSRSFFGSYSDGWSHEALLEGSLERSFKETQYSPREKCNAETQTEQETKSTQCSPDQSGDVVVVVGGGDTAESFESPYEAVADPSIHRRYRYRSPRKEVQTQTQGENKSVQCSLEDLVALRRGSCWQQEQQQLQRQRQHFVGLNVDSVSVLEQIHESKSVQCVPEDISSRIQGDSERHSRDVVQPSRRHRREVEVQTYQESKAIQCFDEELPPLEETTDRFREIPGARRVVLASIELDERPVAETRVSWKTEGSSASSTSLGSSGSPARVKHLSTVPLVSADAAMTVTHRDYDGNVAWSKHWGPERLVEIYREPKTSLGLSIVGGKVDLHNGSGSKSQNISGIFIKNVVPNSPAARTGELKIGDRIIEVDGVDLRNSTHERAVEVIQASGNPVCLLVQSLVHLSADNDAQDGDERTGRTRSRLPVSGVAPGTPTASFRHKPAPVSPARSITPEVIQGGIQDGEKFPSKSDLRGQSPKISDGAGPSSRRSSMKKSVRRKAPSPPSTRGGLQDVREERENHAAQSESTSRRKYSSEESSEEEDVRLLEGNVYTKAGMEISRKSAGNVKRSKAEIEADSEQEDEFGYTTKKIQKKYHNLGHTVLMVKVEKERRGLGISLAGHRDRNRMAVFICGLNPKGAAHKVGGLLVGDEILEVNGMVFQGRCHLNASALIKGMAGMCFKIIVVRREAAVENIAVKPIVQFPPTLDEMDQFSNYKGVRNVPVKKGQYGLGIMIIEGKHAEVGQGIFVSDIQEGSAAEQAGLLVGDMILAVNMDYLLGSTYDEATSLLKKAEGVVTLTVCNPNQSKIGKEEEEKAKAKEKDGGKSEAGTSGAAVTAAAPKEPEKPKEPEPPQDPKECKITAGRETTIEFQKDKDKGIGFTIAGGSDTPMNGVFILEVFPDGAAGKDGRLQAGDQIIQMCQENFKSIEHEKAHGTVLKVTGTINMIVFRDEKPPEEVEVELQKKSGKGAGLCLTGFKSGKGAYVSDLLPGGSALESGKICKGDRVVAICGQDVREASVEDIAVHIKVSNPVQLKLARYQSAKQ